MLLSQGKIEIQGSPGDLAQSGIDFAKLVGIIEENSEQSKSRKASILSTSSNQDENQEDLKLLTRVEGVQMEETSKGKVKGSISAEYFRAGANWFVLCILAISFVFVQILASGADYWVSVW